MTLITYTHGYFKERKNNIRSIERDLSIVIELTCPLICIYEIMSNSCVYIYSTVNYLSNYWHHNFQPH